MSAKGRIVVSGWALLYMCGLATVRSDTPPPWKPIELPFHLVNSEGARKYLPATMPGGIAVADFDGDGRPDIFLANGGELPSGRKAGAVQLNRSFLNRGNMRFDDATANSGLRGADYAFGATAADYNNDGKPDLLVSHLHGVTLYRNTGHGHFENVTTQARLDDQGRWSVGAVWFDYDGDGYLDLYVVNYVAWDPKKERQCTVAGRIDFCHPKYYDPVPGALFRNNGNGTFTDVSGSSQIAAHPGKGMGAVAADFNNDGKLDLFVTNDRLPAFLFQNQGNGRFAEAAFDAGVAVPMDGHSVSGMGVDAQDIDGDSRLELIYTALKDETFPMYRAGTAGFDDITAKTRMGVNSRPYSGWGIQFADLDSDGRLDIVAGTSDALSGKADTSRAGSVVWFRNTGDGKFEAGRPLTAPAMYRGLVAADFDEDGCIDLVTTALAAPALVLRNPCTGGNRKAAAKRKWLGSSATGYASSLWWDPRPEN